jgi:hypothetical protein
MENEHIRVLEIKLPQGAELPMHSHPPRVIVAINAYRLKSTDEKGTVSIVERRSGEVVWSDGEEHAAEVLAGPTHTIEIELKNLG